MDQSAEGERGDEAQSPEDEEDDDERIKHGSCPCWKDLHDPMGGAARLLVNQLMWRRRFPTRLLLQGDRIHAAVLVLLPDHVLARLIAIVLAMKGVLLRA